MMKRLKITVDGTVYDVTVEEVGGEAPAPAAVPLAAPAAAPAPVRAPTPAPRAAAAPTGSGAPGEVVCPLAGTVLRVDVSVGQTVAAGDPVVLLEAMKMESVIAAPVGGAVTAVNVAAGASVREGQVLAVIG